jgi:hypothetical protein
MMIIERIYFELPEALRPEKPKWGPYVVFYFDRNEGWQIGREFSTIEAARSYIKKLSSAEYAPVLIVRIIERWDVG